jgi:hypothetical protein
MNPQRATVNRLAFSIFAGLLFYSSWSMSNARMMMPAGGVPALAHKAPAAKTLSSEQRLRLAHSLGDLMADPGKLTKADVSAVKKAFSAEDARMLEILKTSR